jgi:hypothetical protein
MATRLPSMISEEILNELEFHTKLIAHFKKVYFKVDDKQTKAQMIYQVLDRHDMIRAICKEMRVYAGPAAQFAKKYEILEWVMSLRKGADDARQNEAQA